MSDSDRGLEGSDTSDFTLADLAGLDVSGIEEIRSEQLPAGAFIFRGKKAKLSEMENRNGEKRFVINLTMEVAEVQAVIDKNVDPASLMGKTHTEKFYIVPEDAANGIGRARAFLTDIGLNSAGPLGGMTDEGGDPGVLDGFVDHLFPAKIVGRKANGETYAQLKLPKKTGK